MQCALTEYWTDYKFTLACPPSVRPPGDYGQYCEFSFGPIFTKFPLNIRKKIFRGSPVAISLQRVIRCTSCLTFQGRVFGVGGSNGATSGWTKSKMAAAAILLNFEWPYLSNGSSDPLHIWFHGSVIAVGGSNGTSDWTKSTMTASRHLGKIPMATGSSDPFRVWF